MDVIITALAGATGGLALLLGGSYALQNLYDRAFTRYRQAKWDALSYVAERQKIELDSVRVLQPDTTGRAGIAFDGKVYRDLDTRAIFTQELNLFFDPIMERLNKQIQMLQAIAALGSGAAASKALDAGELGAVAVTWPDVIRASDAMMGRRASIYDLVIGAYPTETGLQVVSANIHDLMHVLEVGASGWGKSSWLRWFLWQIAKATEPIEVVAVDISGSEFNIMRGWGKLRYPVARATGEAVAVLGAVGEEIARRRQLFENNAPVASKLTEYNDATGADLPPWLVCVDEGTHLLNQAGIGEPLRDAVQTARQYGIYVLLAGQSAKHNVIDSQVRDQFSSRLCFRTSPTSSRVVLDESCANDLKKPGRFFAQLVGQELQELQGPFVSREDFAAALTNGGPRHPTPEVLQSPDDEDRDGRATEEERELIMELWAENLSLSEITRRVYGTKGGAGFYKVKEAIEQWDA